MFRIMVELQNRMDGAPTELKEGERTPPPLPARRQITPPPILPPKNPNRRGTTANHRQTASLPTLTTIDPSILPPPKRLIPNKPYNPTPLAPPKKETWGEWGSRHGSSMVDRGFKVTDRIGLTVNGWSESAGGERFWPTTGDFPQEMDKAARILRAFTVEGIEDQEDYVDKNGKKKRKTVFKKISASVIRDAKGLAIFTAFRSGFMPIGGAGGAGVIVAKLPDGSWSAPASISPNNFAAGLLLGIEVYDAILVIRSEEALRSFDAHKVTLGAEMAIAAGPYGVGGIAEAGLEKSPVWSYVKSRGFYAGIDVVGQVFVERAHENAQMYHWDGIRNGNILSGQVAVPIEAEALQSALREAESGYAQTFKSNNSSNSSTPLASITADIELKEGEVLKLPPPPDQVDSDEEGIFRESNAERKRKVEQSITS